jgi:hypothetical protein
MIGAMSTGAAATGARSFIATQHFSWVTPRRMKMITATLLGSALFASSFIVSGSTPRSQTAAPQHAVASHSVSR